MGKTLSYTIIVSVGILTLGAVSCFLKSAYPLWGLLPLVMITLWMGDE